MRILFIVEGNNQVISKIQQLKAALQVQLTLHIRMLRDIIIKVIRSSGTGKAGIRIIFVASLNQEV
jgi:hypothetical protein